MEKLKPCPFCGGEAEIKASYISHYNSPAPFYVKCMKCGAATNVWEYNTEQEATAAWNRRANDETDM